MHACGTQIQAGTCAFTGTDIHANTCRQAYTQPGILCRQVRAHLDSVIQQSRARSQKAITVPKMNMSFASDHENLNGVQENKPVAEKGALTSSAGQWGK